MEKIDSEGRDVLKVQMANEILTIAERYDRMDGVDSNDCVKAIEVAAEKLKENGWDRE